ncbi:MAG: hypothetical protein ACQEVA_23235 [Myxococcota bacterium]
MKISPDTALVAIVFVVAVMACDESSDVQQKTGDHAPAPATASHPAADAAERFLRAIQYSDTRTAAKTHVESTHEGFYCQSDEFQRVFSAAEQRAGRESCEDARALGNDALARLDDQARLAAQMLKVICEEPDATCADYSRRVLEAQRDRWATWTQTLQRFEIQRTIGDPDEAVVYVDVYAAPRGEPDHRTLRMRKVGGSWYVSNALLQRPDAASQQDSPDPPTTGTTRTDPSYESDFD